MVVCDFTAHIPRVKKRKFVPCIRTWKLRDPATGSQFQSAFRVKMMTAASDADVDTANHIESARSKLKGPLLDAAAELCGLSRNQHWKPETWWWKEKVDKVIQEKCAQFMVYSALKRGGVMAEAKQEKNAYIDAKHMAKRVVWLAKSEAEIEEFATVSPDGDGVFCFAKQMDCRNQDIVGENCVCNDAGELTLTDEDKMKASV